MRGNGPTHSYLRRDESKFIRFNKSTAKIPEELADLSCEQVIKTVEETKKMHKKQMFDLNR
jgi:hypothetical protein